MKITKQSIFGKTNTMDIPLTEEQYLEYLYSDKHIQHICPKLPACEREFLINGTTPKEWENMFGGCTFGCEQCKYEVKQIKE